ncbi:Lecithin:cholesterol acyltransferase-domain-containing protein [Russula compacta]|nr:Lecithin:cholesterol acyltransferase-domain-containing protein [Russula compacta]
MIHRTKAKKSAASTATRTERDNLSETDTHSQYSDEVNLAPQAGPDSSRKARLLQDRRRFYSRPRFLFPLGIILGVVLGLIFVEPSSLPDIPGHFSVFLEDYDISLSLPQIDLSHVQAEWKRLISTIPEPWKLNTDGREFQVGDAIKARGLEANHPVVLIPGVISTSLESWSTSPEYRAFFRQKVWGGFPMISQVTFNREKWMSMLLLDPVRASEGFDAASSFIQGYWIWSKVIENLAVVNYDTNNLVLAPYDWRLSMYNLEERDGYFSRLKTTIEGFRKRQKKKCVIAAHSMGSTYFMKWVESPAHGQGGPDWVENHIHAIISIAGTHLGVTKAMAALLSGEMKDTVDVNPAGAYVLERFFSKKERQSLFRSWAGGASMWLKGGNAVWGDATFAPDDEEGGDHTHGELISFRQTIPIPLDDKEIETPPFMQGKTQIAATQDPNKRETQFVLKNMTVDEAGAWILGHTPLTFRKMISTNYSYGIERDEEALKRNDVDHTKWTNPLEIRLPSAPSLQYYCIYGHGKETEVSVWYTSEPYEDGDAGEAVDLELCAKDNTCPKQGLHPRRDMPFSRSWIDKDHTSEISNPTYWVYTLIHVSTQVRNGVKLGEGDGTVSLLSLGAMCAEGWKWKRWNPAGIKVTTVELPHQPEITLPRGGANTSDHVDVLGSNALNEIILKVATGAGDEIRDNYVSRIREYARRIRWDG